MRSKSPAKGEWQVSSILINLEEIRAPEELLERETELQLAAYEQTFSAFDGSLTPDLPFFYYLHHMMFSPLFVWAGRPRTLSISKGGTPFCPPQNIDGLMNIYRLASRGSSKTTS